MDTISIGDAAVTVDDVCRVADGAAAQLAAPARARLAASHAALVAALASGDPVYGLNTGVGHRKDVRLSADELRQGQEMLLITHAGGVGPAAPTELVRAAMFARLVGLAAGGSGASPAAAEVLARMLEAGVHPVVPIGGSVGAGDLGQLATVGLVAIGRGTAEYRDEILPGSEALARAGIEALALGPKDGLALMSANGVSIGHGALVSARADRLGPLADLAVAVSMEAVRGNPDLALPAAMRAKPYPGQVESGRRIRAALEGGALMASGAARSVQDPLSYRVAPQVHGAFREFTLSARRAVEAELNSTSDNPLVSADGAVVHNGNFHPMVMAIAFDALRVAAVHVGQLSERRMGHLWAAFFAQLGSGGPDGAGGIAGPGRSGGTTGPEDGGSPAGPETAAGIAGPEHAAGIAGPEHAGGIAGPAEAVGSSGAQGPPELFGMALRYSAAALVAELRLLAAPATLDVPPLDLNTEDHATNAPLTVRRTEQALDLVEEILTIELLLARDVLATAPSGHRLGTGTGHAMRALDQAVAAAADRSPAAIHRLIRTTVSATLA